MDSHLGRASLFAFCTKQANVTSYVLDKSIITNDCVSLEFLTLWSSLCLGIHSELNTPVSS
jgi:hypothetical protein